MKKAIKKVTINVPAELLDEAIKITGKGVTHTVIEGLKEIWRKKKRSALRGLKGKIEFDLNLERTRN